MFGIQRKIESAARSAALFTVGGVLCAVGAGFLTVAGWIVLSTLYDAATAALILGLIYCGAGLIAVGVGLRKSKSHSPEKRSLQEQDLTPLQLVAVSFLQGFEQGASTKKSR